MIHDDFINYRLTELTNNVDNINTVKQQYLAQLMMLKEALNDCKEMIHQKYNLTDGSVKEFFVLKDGLLHH